MKIATPVPPLGERFWSKVLVLGPDDCWEWQAGTDKKGYGKISYPEPGGRSVPKLAHRLSYLEATGENHPKLDHRCLNPPCVNPNHLRPVTQKQNAENHPQGRSNNTSGFIGVGYSKSKGRWRGYVKHNYKYIHVGYFDEPERAAEAVRLKRLELFTHNELDKEVTSK